MPLQLPVLMESNQAKLFVGGISQGTSEETLLEHFQKYGEVKKSHVIRHNATGHGRGFGFVSFADSSAMDRALEDHHVILGRTVEVKVAEPKVERRQNHHHQQYGYGCQQPNRNNNDSPAYRNKIFVGGLPPCLTEEEFRLFFGSFGTVLDSRIFYDKVNNRPRGFGFVTYESHEAVESVMEQRVRFLKNKCVEIKRAVPRATFNGHNCAYYRHLAFPFVNTYYVPYFDYNRIYVPSMYPGYYVYGSGVWPQASLFSGIR